MWERKTAADLAAAGRGAVMLEEPLPQSRRAPRPVDVHPDRDRLRDGGPVDDQARPALGPMTAGPAAERRELDVVPVPGRSAQHERGAAQHPRAVDPRVGDVIDVVGRHILEITRDCVESEAVGPIHVTETDPAVCDEAPPLLGRRKEFVLHRAPPRAEESGGHFRTGVACPAFDCAGYCGRRWRRSWATTRAMCANTGMSASRSRAGRSWNAVRPYACHC